MLYNAYNREPQTWFCVIRQISRISKSGVFKGGISPSGLSPLALYADYPFIIRSYAIYKRQGKAPDRTSSIVCGTWSIPDSKENDRFIQDRWNHGRDSVVSVCDDDRNDRVGDPGVGDVRISDRCGYYR